MRELSLFTGAGGGVLGTKLLGWETIGYVEWDGYCQRILRQRIEDGIFDEAPIYGDIRAFVGEGFAEAYKGMVDVITAGFPCQPFSVAGKQQGEQDERNMWPATWRCIDAIRPPYVLLENVPGLLSKEYAGEIFKDLAKGGYDARWCCLSASEVGFSHRRERWWLIAYPKSTGFLRANKLEDNKKDQRAWRGFDAAKISHISEQRQGEQAGKEHTESPLLGKFNGVAHRSDRLKAVGNGQVPQVVERVWQILSEDL